MKQAVDLGNDQKRHFPLDTYPLYVTRLTSFVSRALSAVIDDAECHDGLSMTVLSWMRRNDSALPMLAIAASALWCGRTAKSQW